MPAHPGISRASPDVLVPLGPHENPRTVANEPIGMLKEDLARRCFGRGRSPAPYREGVDPHMELQSKAVSLCNRNFEGIPTRILTQRSGQEGRPGFELRAVESIRVSSDLEEYHVELCFAGSFEHGQNDIASGRGVVADLLVGILKPRHPHPPRLTFSRENVSPASCQKQSCKGKSCQREGF